MIVFPNAKINLGLDILSRRKDGYHNLSSCFYPIPLSDLLEVLPANVFTFRSTGIPIPESPGGNLCIKAFELLHNDFDISPVSIHLHKIIPIGAGLGGGSSDASFTLKCLNSIFSLNLTSQDLIAYAAKLGSDCPFFIKNSPILAEGTGNEFSPIDIDLEGIYFVLLNPGIHVSTAAAYSRVKPSVPVELVSEIIVKPIEAWQSLLKNDFEASVFTQFPEIGVIKNQLLENGAVYASMSGSGSSVFGLFNEKPKLPDTLNNLVIWQGVL